MPRQHYCKCNNFWLYGNSTHSLMEETINSERPDYELVHLKLLVAELEGEGVPDAFRRRAVDADINLMEAKNPLTNPRYFDPADLRREWSKVTNVLICMQDVQQVYDEAGVALHPYFGEVRQELEDRKAALEDYFQGNSPQP